MAGRVNYGVYIKSDKFTPVRTFDECFEEIAVPDGVEDKNLELSGQSDGVQSTKGGSTGAFETRKGEGGRGGLCGQNLSEINSEELVEEWEASGGSPLETFPTLSVQRTIREKLEETVLPKALQRQGLARAYFLISTINHAHWAKPKDKRERSEFVRVSSRVLKKVMNTHYRDWITFLVEEGIIERDESYQVGQKCKGFRIHPDLAHGTCDLISVTEPAKLVTRIFDSLDEGRNREFESAGHELLRKNTLELRILDPTAALFRLHYLRQSPDRDQRSAEATQGQTENIQVLADGFRPYKPTETNSARYTVDAYGRFYSPFVNLFREGRADVTLNGEHLTGIDIHASHWFHALMLWPERESEEGQELVSSLVDGDFYEFLLDQAAIPWTTRDELKQPSLAFLHSHPRKLSSAAKVIREAIQDVAPQFLMWLEKEKGTDLGSNSFKRFSHRLMREESSRVIVDTVGDLAKIDPEYPVVTIHDALYVPHSRVCEARVVFEEVFRRKYGVVPRIKVESTEGDTGHLEDRWSFLPGSTAEKAA